MGKCYYQYCYHYILIQFYTIIGTSVGQNILYGSILLTTNASFSTSNHITGYCIVVLDVFIHEQLFFSRLKVQ